MWLNSFSFESNDIDFLVLGIGIPSVIYRLTIALQNEKYDLVINIGTAGSYNGNIKIGDIVNVVSEQFGDIGIDDNGQLRTIFEMGLADNSLNPFSNGRLLNNSDILKYKTISNLNKVNGLTVNRVSGLNETTTERMVKFNPDIETWKVLLFFTIVFCRILNLLNYRAISNKIEPRNTKNWNIPLALTNLNKTLLEVLTEILKW